MNTYEHWLKLVDLYYDYDEVAVALPKRLGFLPKQMGSVIDEDVFSFDVIARQHMEDFRGYHVETVVIFRKAVPPRYMKRIIRPMIRGRKKRIHFIGDVR